MRKYTSAPLTALLESIGPEEEGMVVVDPDGAWKGVLLTAESYQLLRGAAELAANPELYLRSYEANERFQRGDKSRTEVVEFEQLFGKVRSHSG